LGKKRGRIYANYSGSLNRGTLKERIFSTSSMPIRKNWIEPSKWRVPEANYMKQGKKEFTPIRMTKY
jgi:hypothetical protein